MEHGALRVWVVVARCPCVHRGARIRGVYGGDAVNVSNAGCSWWSVAGFVAWVLCLGVVADMSAPSLARIGATALWVLLSVVGCAVAGRGGDA